MGVPTTLPTSSNSCPPSPHTPLRVSPLSGAWEPPSGLTLLASFYLALEEYTPCTMKSQRKVCARLSQAGPARLLHLAEDAWMQRGFARCAVTRACEQLGVLCSDDKPYKVRLPDNLYAIWWAMRAPAHRFTAPLAVVRPHDQVRRQRVHPWRGLRRGRTPQAVREGTERYLQALIAAGYLPAARKAA